MGSGPIASVGLFLFCFWLAVDRVSLRVRKVMLLIATLLAYPWAVYSFDHYMLESGRTQWRFDWMPWWFPYFPAAEELTTIPIQIFAPRDWDELVNYQGEGVVTVNPRHAGRLWGYMAVILAVSVAFEIARTCRQVKSYEIPRRRRA